MIDIKSYKPVSCLVEAQMDRETSMTKRENIMLYIYTTPLSQIHT